MSGTDPRDRTKMANILLVDDDVILLQMLQRILDAVGHTCMGVTCGYEAHSRYGSFRPDVSIIDVWMPRPDGFETFGMIRADFPDAKVIMLSGHMVFDERPIPDIAAERGANAAVEKPFDAGELRDLVARVLALPPHSPMILLPAYRRMASRMSIPAIDLDVERRPPFTR